MNTGILLTILSLVSPSASAAEVPPLRSLFNGQDLSGWSGVGYVVEDGTIVCTAEGKNLVSEQTFSNYVLDFEFKLSPGGNSGLGIHYPGSGDGAYAGMEIQILDNTAPKHHELENHQLNGSLYKLAPAKSDALKPVGEWNHERVTVSGPALVVELNGEIILRANLDELSSQYPEHEGAKRRAGHIAWLGHGPGVALRNIQIVENPPAANTEGVMASGFKRLFDDKSLGGWKPADGPDWTTSNRILRYSSRTGDVANLWSEKEFGDFILVFDWRWSARGPMQELPVFLADGTLKTSPDGQQERFQIETLDSGIHLRGSATGLVNLWTRNIGSGTFSNLSTYPVIPAMIKADKPPGEWNRTMITMKGNHLTVTLNGKAVLDNAQLPDIPDKGSIGLQGRGSAIDFANLWIRDL